MASINERIKEYGSTPTGKIMMIAAPAAVLALIVAVIALTVLGSGGSDGQQTGDAQPVKAAATGISTTSTPETTAAQPPEAGDPPVNLDYEVYETRDPFRQPDTTATQTAAVAPSATPAANGGTAIPAAEQQSSVLFLKSVNSENGVLYAGVDYGATSYVVRAGERVGSSPYQITSISTDSATFLYGDDSVVLRVGEDVQK